MKSFLNLSSLLAISAAIVASMLAFASPTSFAQARFAEPTPERRAYLDEERRRYWNLRRHGYSQPQLYDDFLRDFPEKGLYQSQVAEMKKSPAEYAKSLFESEKNSWKAGRRSYMLEYARSFSGSPHITEARELLEVQAQASQKLHVLLQSPSPACAADLDKAVQSALPRAGLAWYASQDVQTQLITPKGEVLADLSYVFKGESPTKNLKLSGLPVVLSQHSYFLQVRKGETEATSTIENRDYFELAARPRPDGSMGCSLLLRFSVGDNLPNCNCVLSPAEKK